ncbi:MAG: hypothetical protein RR355_00140 [Oscillospiraceae bacterium]
MAHKKMTKKQKRDAIEKSLKIQLTAKKADEIHFLDKIDEYMELWDIKQKLNLDIKKRGINFEETMSTGFTKKVSNPSVKELVAVSKQSLSILKELGITTEQNICANGDEL